MTDAEAEVQVSVLIPVLNESAILPDAARAMLAQELPGRAEFLFVDGGSADDSVAILQAMAAADPRVGVLTNPARHIPHALNIGLRAATGEFVARMDAHTIYPPSYLADGIQRLRRGDVDWVSGPALAVGNDAGSRRVARALRTPMGKGGARFRDDLKTEHEVDTGFTGVWRRETLERHGGWDEEWLNDSDMELAARFRQAGRRIVCMPEMAGEYVPRSTFRALARQYLTYGTYRVKTAQRHPETLRRSQLLPPLVTVAAGASFIAPGARLRALARVGVALYGGALIAAAGRAGGDGPRAGISSGVGRSDHGRSPGLAALPAVWAVMHLSYGLGFLRGCLRYGPPVAAVSHIVRAGPSRGKTAAGHNAQ